MNLARRVARLLAVDGAAVVLAFIIMVAFFSVKSDVFLTGENLRNLLVEAVFVVLITAGMTYVLLVGGIDLSVGATLGLSGGVTYFSLLHGVPVVLAVAIGILFGAFVGAVNGLIISGLGVNAFIVTLAMMSIEFGVLAVLTAKVTLAGANSSTFSSIAGESVLGIPIPVVICAVIVLAFEWMLIKTPFGRGVHAAGMSPRAAQLAGVSVNRVRFLVYVLSGAAAGLAGVVQASRLNSVQAGLGSGYELTTIAAAVLGGISLAGGRGTVWRGVIGALFLATLSRGLQLLGVDPLWFTIVTGASIILAIAFDRGVQRVAAGWLTLKSPAATPPERRDDDGIAGTRSPSPSALSSVD
ncbi:ABC transporter permease [Micromonospora sp. NPDC005237]|uniref:ABC transporter permease n=1 Tax=Micromonospora sp. NPDC005237 TaxID=3155113 RepID=UPI0033BF83DE